MKCDSGMVRVWSDMLWMSWDSFHIVRLLIPDFYCPLIHAQETVAIKSCSGYSFKVTQQGLHVAMYQVVFNETVIPPTLIDTKWLQPTQYYVPHWLSITSHLMHAHWITVNYFNTNFLHISYCNWAWAILDYTTITWMTLSHAGMTHACSCELDPKSKTSKVLQTVFSILSQHSFHLWMWVWEPGPHLPLSVLLYNVL